MIAEDARHPRGGIYFEDFVDRRDHPAPADADGHPDGQHAVLEHDAEPAAPSHRRAFLRHRDGMGQPADELPLHPRAHDRHLRQRHDGRHDHRQSRHDGREVPRSAFRGRHAERDRQRSPASGNRSRGPTRASSTSSTAPTSRTARSSRNAGGRPSCASARPPDMRSLLFVPGDSARKLEKALASGRRRAHRRPRGFGRCRRRRTRRGGSRRIPQGREGGPGPSASFTCASTALRPASPTPISTASWRQARTASCCPRRSAARTCPISAPSSPCARRNSTSPTAARGIIAIATENARGRFRARHLCRRSHRLMGLAWGGEDLSADIGAETNRVETAPMPSPIGSPAPLTLLGAAAAEVDAIDAVYTNFRDLDGLGRRMPRGAAATASPPRWRSIPAQVAGHQRGLHALRRSACPGAGGHRGFRRKTPARASSASRARCSTGRTSSGPSGFSGGPETSASRPSDAASKTSCLGRRR